VNDDQSRLAAPGDQIKGDDGFAAAGRRTQGPEFLCQHVLRSPLLKRPQTPRKLNVHRRYGMASVLQMKRDLLLPS
jgi:hypothetical protein